MKLRQHIRSNKAFAWLGVVTGALLLIPFIIMQARGGVAWGAGDFLLAAVLLYGTGTLFILLARIFPRIHPVLLAGILVCVTAFIWVEFAVGVFTALGS